MSYLMSLDLSVNKKLLYVRFFIKLTGPKVITGYAIAPPPSDVAPAMNDPKHIVRLIK